MTPDWQIRSEAAAAAIAAGLSDLSAHPELAERVRAVHAERRGATASSWGAIDAAVKEAGRMDVLSLAMRQIGAASDALGLDKHLRFAAYDAIYAAVGVDLVGLELVSPLRAPWVSVFGSSAPGALDR